MIVLKHVFSTDEKVVIFPVKPYIMPRCPASVPRIYLLLSWL